MSASGPEVLLLALGNDLLADDGVGLAAARALAPRFEGRVEVVESAESGLALLELIAGYDRALLLDAMLSGRFQPGAVTEFGASDFRRVVAPSPHYAGLPEVLALAERIGVEVPRELRVLAMEVENPHELRSGFSPRVERALPAFIDRAGRILEAWTGSQAPSPVDS